MRASISSPCKPCEALYKSLQNSYLATYLSLEVANADLRKNPCIH
jgi:hypothetical protein